MLETALTRATGMGGLVARMPDQIEQLMHDVETGNLQVRVVTPELDQLPMLLRWSSGRLTLALFAATLSLCCAVLVAGGLSNPWAIALAVFCAICAVSGWIGTFLSYFVGSGQTVRVSPWIKLFRRS